MYSQEVKAKGKGHHFAPLHLHIFNSFVARLLECGIALGQRTSAVLKLWHEKVLCELQPEDLCDMLALFRVMKCSDQSQRNIHLMLRDVPTPTPPPESDEPPLPSPIQVRALLARALAEIGGRTARGAAPPGGHGEEIIQHAVGAKEGGAS
ncbi:unnamed protein product [Prorocentrum cordatum]|uniref:Uncharacterized protein n=1 Tax=Prorocentrum cordatum TaxID=2364126 RepID=A0ABN9XTY7_9DINO|nr:unnamed protein product [Polarella glacialis]